MQYVKRYLKNSENIDDLDHITVQEDLPKYRIISNGVVLPRKTLKKSRKEPYQGVGGVVDQEGNYVIQSAVYDLKKNVSNREVPLAFGGAYPYVSLHKIESSVVYLGMAHQQWGHFLMDVIQRCWYPYNYQCEDFCFVFSGFGDGIDRFRGNYLTFFKLLGIDESKIIIVNSPTAFSTVIVPDAAIIPGEKIYGIFIKMIRSVVHNAVNEFPDYYVPDSVYFSRRHLKDVKEIGENRIEQIMKEAGITIIYPEELSLIEQILYWQKAKRLFCISGSIPHNCIFANEDTELFIFTKMEKMVGYQFTMDKVAGIRPVYISAYKEPFRRYPIDVSRGPFWISITEEVKYFFEEYYNLEITNKIKIREWIEYFVICAIAEMRYRFRGTGSRLRVIKKKLCID